MEVLGLVGDEEKGEGVDIVGVYSEGYEPVMAGSIDAHKN